MGRTAKSIDLTPKTWSFAASAKIFVTFHSFAEFFICARVRDSKFLADF